MVILALSEELLTDRLYGLQLVSYQTFLAWNKKVLGAKITTFYLKKK